VYDNAKQFATDKGYNTYWCGPLAGVISSAITNPMVSTARRTQWPHGIGLLLLPPLSPPSPPPIGSTEPPCRFSCHPVATSARPRQDLVKTRLQVAASNPSAFDYEGTFDCARKIVQREGAVALFDGVLSRVLLLTPRLTIAVTCYEMAREALTSSNGDSDETGIEK